MINCSVSLSYPTSDLSGYDVQLLSTRFMRFTIMMILLLAVSDMTDECYTESDSDIGFRQATDDLSSETPTPIEDALTYSLTPTVRFSLVVLVRIGFLLVQVGSIPITNINLILLHNLLDFCWASFVFMIFGTVIAYTGDISGIIGAGYWVGHEKTDKEEIMIGWQAIVIASAICTTYIVGRMHTVGSLIMGIVMSGILHPFIIHWTWTTNGWMTQRQLFGYKVHFRDYSGSAVVHIVGGLTGLIGCISLGRRLLKLREIDNASISVGAAATAFCGHLFIILGLQTLSISHSSSSSNEKLKKRIPIIPVNNIMSMSSCAMVVIALHFMKRDPFNHWTVMRCTQAVTAGAILVSAGVDVYSPLVCLILGCVGGALFYLASKLIFRSALEDYCNTVVLHVIIALLGSLVAPFFYDRSEESSSHIAAMFIDFAWKLICLLCIFACVILIMSPLFFILNWIGLLRNRSEFLNHMRSLAAVQRAPPRSGIKRLFNIHDDSILIQPGMSGQDIEIYAGQYSTKYQRTLTRIEIDDTANDEKEYEDTTLAI